MPRNLWEPGAPQEGLASLVYRSRLLAADRSIVNIYGGNTSAKLMEIDHLGRPLEVLWVKGSGSDMAAIDERGFTGLKLAEVLPLFEREALSDEEMVAYLERTLFEPHRPRQSIETLLHAFIPAPHVDHTHPDAILALACHPRGQALIEEVYGRRAGWVDYLRPGFELARRVGRLVRERPELECVVLGKHGLVTWGATSQACYEQTLEIIQAAEDYLQPRIRVFSPGPKLAEPERRELLAQLLPVLRGSLGGGILQVDQDPDVLDFVGSSEAAELSQVGAACPDHLVHTKRLPLYLDWHPEEGGEGLKAKAVQGVARYREAYQAYFEAHRGPQDRSFPPTPRVILVPGLGLITAGPDAHGAEVTRQLYRRAIEVMRGAWSLGGFVSLTEAESFAVEYWPLELYKLSLRPPARPLEGKVALITGGASGIGRAAAYRLAQEGAHVLIADLNEEGGERVARELRARHGFLRGLALKVDVTEEASVQRAFQELILTYGGLDIVVNNAGISSSAPIEATSLELWNRNMAVLATGYFLVAREAFRLLKAQQLGGSLIFVGSKNSVAASRNASAYSAAKAAELHLARCLAEEGGEAGIRVNTVLPDAVLSGSSIWSSSWREERAATYGIAVEDLEEFYRKRTTLKVNILPEDVAEAIYFFASPASRKTTGGVLTVDGGVPTAYVR